MECTVSWTGGAGTRSGMGFVAETGSGHVLTMDGAPDAANPANGGQNLLGLDRTAFEGAPMISGTTAASCTVSCSSDVRGALFGPGASHVGLGYAIKDGSLAVSGVATFAAQPPAPPVP